VVQTADGYVFSGFTSTNAQGIADMYLVKFNADGDIVWTKQYDAHGSTDQGYCIRQTSDDGFIIAGFATEFGYGDQVYLVKTDADGNLVWDTTYGGTHQDYARAVQQTADGGYIVAGYTYSFGAGDADIWLVRTNSAGDTLWEMRYNGTGNGDDNANALVVDSAGNVFVTGGSMGPVQTDYATIKYNFSGNIEWVSRYNGPDDDIDEGFDIVLDHMGNVYVAGQSYATQPYTPEFDFLTVKYNPSGVEQWTHRYNGPGDSQDHMYVAAVDEVGNVYVTGSSVGNVGYEDIATIKYGVTGVNEETGCTTQSTGYNLSVSPNPFHQQTKIRYSILDTRYLINNPTLRVYDASGRLVRTLNPVSSIENLESEVIWDGTDQSNRQLGSGVYFVRLEASDYQETRQVLLIR